MDRDRVRGRDMVRVRVKVRVGRLDGDLLARLRT